MAAWATRRRCRLNAISATPRSPRSTKAPARSSAWSSPATRRGCADMRACLLAPALALVFAPALAADTGASPDPWRFPAEAAEGLDFVREGLRTENIMAADFDADGRMDQAIIVKNTEQRVLLVLMANKSGGYRRIGYGELDGHPLGETQLSAPKGVLVIEDLTGGTTAIESTYRYRYDKATDRMRLI